MNFDFLNKEQFMPQFFLSYHGGKPPETPEEGTKHMARWNQWVKDQGDNWVTPGAPLTKTMSITSDGITEGGGYEISGFSVLKADTLDAAMEVAKACPFVEIGTLQIAQMMEFPSSK